MSIIKALKDVWLDIGWICILVSIRIFDPDISLFFNTMFILFCDPTPS